MVQQQFGKTEETGIVTSVKVNFPQPFATESPTILVTLEEATGGGRRSFEIQDVNAEGFTVHVGTAGYFKVNWLALADA